MSHIFEALQKSAYGQPDPLTLPPEIPAEVLRIDDSQREDLFDVPSITIAPRPESRLVTLTQQETLAAEKFRFLAVRLRQLQASRGLKRLLITSTIPEEGKSLVAANIAFTLARRQPKVLLIDGDLRKSSLPKTLGVASDLPGLSEWLRDSTREFGNIVRLDKNGPYFLPPGSTPENPLELMQVPRFGRLLEQLSRTFDWVVIDSPPILPLGDTTVWAKACEGILIVTREGITQKQHLKRGIEALGTTKIIGSVLNGCSTVDHKYYYSHYNPSHIASPSKTNGKSST